VWSKALFLSGPERIGPVAGERGLAALWVEADGRLRRSDAADEHLVWKVSNVGA
jgi:hypothetical protein